MITLNEYIKESLLDDEDELLDNADKQVLLSRENNWIKTGQPSYPGVYKYIDKKLYLNDGNVNLLNGFGELLKDCKEVWAYEVNTGEFFKNNSMDNTTLNCCTLYNNKYVSHVEINNTTINIENRSTLRDVLDKYAPLDGKMNRYIVGNAKPVKFFSNTCTLNNVNINICDDHEYKNILFSCQKLPTLKNVKSNAESVIMYSPGLLKEAETINIMDKLFELGFKYEYVDNKKGVDVEKTIKNFKHIYTVINNRSKYNTNTLMYDIFKLRTDVKFSDYFPWVKDMPDLNDITIYDNNVMCIFRKRKFHAKCNAMWSHYSYTKDDWTVVIKQHK